MIRVAVVEDEETHRNEIQEFLTRYSKEHSVQFSVRSFPNAIQFLDRYDHDFELVLMDIALPELDGMSAIKKLREIDGNILVIFVTSLAQYAINGYEVGAFDFLLKPVSYYNLVMKIDRALERIGSRSEKKIWVSSRSEKKLISVSKLQYVEVIKHKIIYHTVEGSISTVGSMKNVCAELEGLPFELCNQCYLVNLFYVTGIDDYKCLLGKKELQISLPKRKSFIRALNNYLAGGSAK